MTWFDTLRENLQTPWLRSEQAVPFSLGAAPCGEWFADRWGETAPGTWTLEAHSSVGLEAVWHARFFADTRALECWGEITYRGADVVKNIGDALSFDARFAWPEATHNNAGAWVRSLNGVRFSPSFPTAFPPHDFALVDRQLVMTGQMYSALNVMGLDDGRPSGETVPCAVVCDARETCGLAFFLEWAGAGRISIGQEAARPGDSSGLDVVSFQVGIRGLGLELQPGQSVPLPRVLVTAFDGDLEAGGNALRRHIRRHVMPMLDGKEALPPVSFNHWFAFENNFTAELLKPAVKSASEAGMEYFSVDGGWFNGGFRAGIGNWNEGDKAKFPDGIAPFSDYVRECGLKFGSWFEPEWAATDSEMVRDHPDWFFTIPGNAMQLMNFGLREVQQWWVARFVRAYEEWGMRWVRWDFNAAPAPSWAFGEREGERGRNQIAYVQGLYQTMDEIIQACPDLLIEQCASGGHRIELGTVRRGHTFWMNDITTSTDLVRAFQHGLNSVLPGIYANTNLCQGRHDFSPYDFLSHSAGGFGYSGRIWEAPEKEFANLKHAIADYKSFRHLLGADYARPTGQPRRADEYTEVQFSDGRETLSMEWNCDGPRTARWNMDSAKQ